MQTPPTVSGSNIIPLANPLPSCITPPAPPNPPTYNPPPAGLSPQSAYNSPVWGFLPNDGQQMGLRPIDRVDQDSDTPFVALVHGVAKAVSC